MYGETLPGSLPPHLFPVDDGWRGDPNEFASRILSQSKSSFAFGLRTLSRPRREAMIAVYAFARTVDDITDSNAPACEKMSALNAWKCESERVYEGRAQSAIGRALEVAAPRFALPKREFLLMLEGMVMDVEGPIVGPTMNVLADYTRRVAGTVGQLSVRCFGAAASPHRDIFALALADALQLTNILRDVEEDAAIGRIYLPRELLDAHGVPADPAEIAHHPALAAVCSALGGIAREQFASARAALGHLDQKALRPALIFMGVYEGYLDRMEAAGWQSARMRPMGRWQKVARGLRYAFWLPERDPPAPSAVAGHRFPARAETPGPV